MDIQPLGAVVESDSSLFVVVGYAVGSKEGLLKLSYRVVPYPLGYMSDADIHQVEVDGISKVLFRGWRDEDSDSFLLTLENLAEAGKDVALEDLEVFMAELTQVSEAQEGRHA